MALIQCPECGKEISDKAASCPNCGCPIVVVKETQQVSEMPANVNKNSIVAQCRTDVESSCAMKPKMVSKKLIVTLGVAVVVVIVVVLIGLLVSNRLTENEKLVLENCKTLRNMCKDPTSFMLYDDVYIYESKDVGTIVYIEYGAKNSFGTMIRGLAIFGEEEYIGDFDDDEDDFYSQSAYDAFMVDYKMPYYWAENVTGSFADFEIVEASKIERRLK